MITNASTQQQLTTRTRLVRGLLRQAFGLMFRPTLQDEGWVFLLPRVSSWDVTNVFVFQTITVLWLDKNKKVLKKALLKPFVPRSAGIRGTCFLIELPADTFSQVSVGDRISWSESKRI